MREAFRLAREGMADGRGGPFGAVVTRAGEIVGRGSNRVVRTQDPTAHAEVVAIREACRVLGTHVLEGCEVFTTCEPCPMCLAAVYWARVARAYHAGTRQDAAAAGFDDAVIFEELRLPIDQRRLPMRVLLRDEARALFDEWRAHPDKVPY
jgi:tRNA(Arg) A34 adenosine deaminase TadA